MDEQKLHASLIRHALASQGLGKAQADEYVRLLNAVDDDLVSKIAARYALIEQKGFDRGPASTKRLEDMLESVREVNSRVYRQIAAGARANLTDLATAEAEFAAKAVRAAGQKVDINAVLPSSSFIRTLIETTPIPVDKNGAALLKPWIDGMEAGRFKRLEDTIRNGLFEGETTDALVNRIRGTRSKQYQDGILNVSRQSAQAFAITANSSIQNAARTATFRNMKTIRYVEWSSVLDGRTSEICQSRSGTIYELAGAHPSPPAHPRCRSILLPRRDNVGTKHKPFGDWLRDQPEDVQDEVLGRDRAAIFRANPKADFSAFFRDNGSYRTVDELRRFDDAMFAKASRKAPEKPVTASPAPVETPKRFTTPIDPTVRSETISVAPRKDAVKNLTVRMASGARDTRYDPLPEFKGIKADQFGKAALGSAFTDEAASMIAALYPELERLSDAFGIPRLRAIKSGTGGYIATMGDGVLTMNATYFNGYAATVRERTAAGAAAKLIEQRDALAAELKIARDALAADRVKLGGLAGREREDFIQGYLTRVDEFNAKRAVWMKLDKQVLLARRTDAAATKPVSTWKPGDGVETRPHNATDYFDGIDRARMVMFHEFGHHVHQMLGKRGRRSQVGKPPLEKQLAGMFFNKFHGAAPGNLSRGSERKKLVSTSYATTNEHEWWAESFGLYMMGRIDLVDPDLKELIDRLLEEAANAGT